MTAVAPRHSERPGGHGPLSSPKGAGAAKEAPSASGDRGRTTYQPTSITPRVTEAHKRAVWNALPPGTRLPLDEIARLTGIADSIVIEVWSMASAAGALRYVDEGAGFRGIERVIPKQDKQSEQTRAA